MMTDTNRLRELALPGEKWKPIDIDCEYAVSSFGRVVSFKRKSIRILKPCIRVTNWGYRYEAVYIKRKYRKISRLVAKAFLGDDKPMVLHNNGNSLDNRLENLRLGNCADNYEDSRVHGTAPIGKKHGMAKLSDEQVLEIRRISKPGRLGTKGSGNLSEVAAMFGIHVTYVRYLIKNRFRKEPINGD